jgi:hypothetical protein
VKDDLPNAVSVGYRMSCRVFRRNIRQHFEHRRPMPGLSVLNELQRTRAGNPAAALLNSVLGRLEERS